MLRPDREGVYLAALQVYDGCAAPVRRTFTLTVAWEQECVTRAKAEQLGFLAPIILILGIIFVVGMYFLPPLSWAHPRQINMDAMAAAEARRNADAVAVALAEAVVDRPRVAAKAERDALDSEQVRLARRLTHAATAIRGAVPGSGAATSPGASTNPRNGSPVSPTSARMRKQDAMNNSAAGPARYCPPRH